MVAEVRSYSFYIHQWSKLNKERKFLRKCQNSYILYNAFKLGFGSIPWIPINPYEMGKNKINNKNKVKQFSTLYYFHIWLIIGPKNNLHITLEVNKLTVSNKLILTSWIFVKTNLTPYSETSHPLPLYYPLLRPLPLPPLKPSGLRMFWSHMDMCFVYRHACRFTQIF